MEIRNLTSVTFDSAVSSSDKLIAVDFWADWCGPCKMLTPVIDALAAEMTEVEFYKVNVDTDPAIAIRFGISAIPCVLFFKGGALVGRSVGFTDKDTMRKRMEEHL